MDLFGVLACHSVMLRATWLTNILWPNERQEKSSLELIKLSVEPPGYIRRLEYIKDRYFRGKKVRLAEALQVKPPYVTELLDPAHQKKNLGREKIENLVRYLREHKLASLSVEWIENGNGPGPREELDPMTEMDAILGAREEKNQEAGRKVYGIPRSTLDRIKPDLLPSDALVMVARDALKLIEETNEAVLEDDVRKCRRNAIVNLTVIAAEFMRREPFSSVPETDAVKLLKAAEQSVDQGLGSPKS